MRALSDMTLKPAGPRWSDLPLRAASAIVLGALAIYCVWHGGWTWALFIGAAMAGLSWEWARLAGLKTPTPVAGLILLLWACAVSGNLLLALLNIILLTAMEWRFYSRFTALGVPYVALGGLSLLWLRGMPGTGLVTTLFLVAVVWGTDIGAYAAGRLFGGKKLAPSISPGKTWAGALGGLVVAALAGAALAGWGHGMKWGAMPAALLLSIVAQAGDLLESAIKRKLGVKDSGRTIPGHGGLFDRLDGFLIAAPVAAVLSLCMQGGPLWP